jgi:hypothetical protein
MRTGSSGVVSTGYGWLLIVPRNNLFIKNKCLSVGGGDLRSCIIPGSSINTWRTSSSDFKKLCFLLTYALYSDMLINLH